MQNGINHLDTNDDGLKAIFGERFHDETTTATPARRNPTTKANPAKAVKTPAIPTKTEPDTARDANWKPVKTAPTDMDKFKACAKWVFLFGGLCILFFYWQQSGQMADSAAVPSMCTCCALAGLGVGRNAIRG